MAMCKCANDCMGFPLALGDAKAHGCCFLNRGREASHGSTLALRQLTPARKPRWAVLRILLDAHGRVLLGERTGLLSQAPSCFQENRVQAEERRTCSRPLVAAVVRTAKTGSRCCLCSWPARSRCSCCGTVARASPGNGTLGFVHLCRRCEVHEPAACRGDDDVPGPGSLS